MLKAYACKSEMRWVRSTGIRQLQRVVGWVKFSRLCFQNILLIAFCMFRKNDVNPCKSIKKCDVLDDTLGDNETTEVFEHVWQASNHQQL